MSNLEYIRAHQYLYYVKSVTVITDYEYDMFGRDTGEDYKGGSDRAEDYTEAQIHLALMILKNETKPLP
jgi:hypothetical protein